MRHLLIAQIVGASLFAVGLVLYFAMDSAAGVAAAGAGALVFMAAAILARMKSGEP